LRDAEATTPRESSDPLYTGDAESHPSLRGQKRGRGAEAGVGEEAEEAGPPRNCANTVQNPQTLLTSTSATRSRISGRRRCTTYFGLVFFISFSYLSWIFEPGAGSATTCAALSLHAASTLLRPHCSTPLSISGTRLRGNRFVGRTSPSLRRLGGVNFIMAAAYRAEG
jgi:hypothetical protein